MSPPTLSTDVQRAEVRKRLWVVAGIWDSTGVVACPKAPIENSVYLLSIKDNEIGEIQEVRGEVENGAFPKELDGLPNFALDIILETAKDKNRSSGILYSGRTPAGLGCGICRPRHYWRAAKRVTSRKMQSLNGGR